MSQTKELVRGDTQTGGTPGHIWDSLFWKAAGDIGWGGHYVNEATLCTARGHPSDPAERAHTTRTLSCPIYGTTTINGSNTAGML
eukprot:4496808-Amphidinium_carterae.2